MGDLEEQRQAFHTIRWISQNHPIAEPRSPKGPHFMTLGGLECYSFYVLLATAKICQKSRTVWNVDANIKKGSICLSVRWNARCCQRGKERLKTSPRSANVRTSPEGVAYFIDVRQRRDTAAPSFGSWNAWIGLVIGARRCMAVIPLGVACLILGRSW